VNINAEQRPRREKVVDLGYEITLWVRGMTRALKGT
jgi:hypothetical protein